MQERICIYSIHEHQKIYARLINCTLPLLNISAVTDGFRILIMHVFFRDPILNSQFLRCCATVLRCSTQPRFTVAMILLMYSTLPFSNSYFGDSSKESLSISSSATDPPIASLEASFFTLARFPRPAPAGLAAAALRGCF